LNKSLSKTLSFYKKKMKVLKSEGDRSFKKDAVNDAKLLYARLSDLVVEKASEEIKEKYAGKKYIWIPSDAEEQDPEHALNYGKTFIVGEGEMPGERLGCRCGMEILADEDDKADNIILQDGPPLSEEAKREMKDKGEQVVKENEAKELKDKEKEKPLELLSDKDVLTEEQLRMKYKEKGYTQKEIDEMIYVVKAYTGDYYKVINAVARGDMDEARRESSNLDLDLAQVKKDVEILRKALSINEISNVMLFRNLLPRELIYRFGKETFEKMIDVIQNGNPKEIDNVVKAIEGKKHMDYPYFTSTKRTKQGSYAESAPVQVVINVIEGTQALPVEKISLIGDHEREVLLQKDIDMNIEKAWFDEKENRFVIEVTVRPLYKL
jgi:hypothetical protein